jgi:hypothetical protein
MFPTGCGIFESDMAITNCGMDRCPNLLSARAWSCGLIGILVGAMAAGCAHSGKHEAPPPTLAGIPPPELPFFLNGAMALLLTNVDGFRARAVLEGSTTGKQANPVAGELMEREGKLLFAPEPAPAAGKRSRAEDFSYIWDVKENRGYMLNGPLQGYAPVSSNARFTNVLAGPGGNGAAEKIAGHSCQAAEATVAASDGRTMVFHVWRATDLQGLPLRITCTADGAPLTLNLTKVRLELPPNDLFQPPDGFTKYSSAEGMVTELVARQENLKRKRGWQPPPTDEIGFRDAKTPGRSQPQQP